MTIKSHFRLISLISVEDLALLEAVEDSQDIKIARHRLKTLKKHGTTALKQFKKEIE